MKPKDNAAPLERRVRRDQNEAEAVAIGSFSNDLSTLSDILKLVKGKMILDIKHNEGVIDSLIIEFSDKTKLEFTYDLFFSCGLSSIE